MIRLLAVIEFVLVGFSVDFPTNDPLRNIAFGLALLALGGVVPRVISIPTGSASD